MITNMSLVSLMYQVANMIADERYGELLSLCNDSWLDENGISAAVAEHPATFVSPPDGVYPTRDDDIIEMNGAEVPTWDISIPLWSKKGRTDLCVMLDCIEQDGRMEILLKGIYVP